MASQSHFSQLNEQVSSLFKSQLKLCTLNSLELDLWLVDEVIERTSYSPAEVEAIWANMPYWAFAWSSGCALAQYVLQNPERVKDKVIADFGAGSGLVALAALKAGAKAAWACDIDPQALFAAKENAKQNGLEVFTCESIESIPDLDLILVGDVLYDPRNHNLAPMLFSQDTPLIWAESRAQTKLSQYGPVAKYEAHTIPNIGGFDEHTHIHIYHHGLI